MRRVFTYWDGDDVDVLAPQVEHCRERFPDYGVMTRGEARALLAARSPQHLEAFDRIRIPACRSDIARLLGLATHGGLYIDAHCRIDDPEAVDGLFDRLRDRDVVVSTRYAPKFEKVMPHNSIVWSRPDGVAANRLLDLALANLSVKYDREREAGFEPYHVWDITGPGVFWRELFEIEADDGRLRAAWGETVATVFETDNPVTRHVFMGYRGPGRHWSERQAVEPLFD